MLIAPFKSASAISQCRSSANTKAADGDLHHTGFVSYTDKWKGEWSYNWSIRVSDKCTNFVGINILYYCLLSAVGYYMDLCSFSLFLFNGYCWMYSEIISRLNASFAGLPRSPKLWYALSQQIKNSLFSFLMMKIFIDRNYVAAGNSSSVPLAVQRGSLQVWHDSAAKWNRFWNLLYSLTAL